MAEKEDLDVQMAKLKGYLEGWNDGCKEYAASLGADSTDGTKVCENDCPKECCDTEPVEESAEEAFFRILDRLLLHEVSPDRAAEIALNFITWDFEGE